ncbi:helix-turn-helix domain-containing protein [Gordonia sp. w5E2]|uniref:Fis family transcriptional regulator n=1 Tax=Gordonia jacobaea TaxID=122202 RepID=A0ABR5ICK1_9ACTN|nr:helix-turn-helix domain-containing protein [Gordonia jacobaea]KNA91459.1 Fis family transcriptional regulator [Gordonia jacobaea]
MTIDTSFASSESAPQRAVIAQSWRRSALSGVQPDSPLPELVDDASRSDVLLDAARPVLDDAAARLADTGTSLLLVDHECRMVSRVCLGTTVDRALDRVGATPGVDLGEETVGTTALGTPAEIRRGLAVNGREHYLEQFKSLSCFGAPIIHPATRRLAGILCMTEIADRMNPLAVPLVTGIVGDIADRLLDRSRAQQRRVLDAFQRAAPRRDVAVAAISEDLQLTNSRAAELLSPTDIAALRAVAADPALRETTLQLVLASGVDVEVLATPVVGARGAALFGLRPNASTARPMVRTDLPSTRQATTAITGEPGTGRSTRARSMAGPDAMTVDVAELLITGDQPDIGALIGDSRRRSRALIVDGVDLLDDRSLTILAAACRTADKTAPLVLVAGPPDQSRTTVAALTARCATRIDVPALRNRTSELADIVDEMLTDIAPGTAPGSPPVHSVSAPTLEALVCQEWPGNLVELSSVLRRAVRSCEARGARAIEPADLPADHRTTSRAAHLSGREQAERAAILEALDRHTGNKVHAARDLGISRTTLYARIRALGI